ncbi:MAG: hypothetical protein M3070_02160 [Actinomycetota bacterium]|nr:hypothetical protein [Actinomycetota bacterium]
MTPRRDDSVTMTACPVCGTPFAPSGRQRFCGQACRQSAYRARQPAVVLAPIEPGVARRDVTIYECSDCGQRYHAQQWCQDCNRPCQRLGTGGPCPSCGDPITIDDLIRQ